MNNEENKPFLKKYSAPNVNERREIESIRRQYTRDESASKIDYVKSLDKKIHNTPKILCAIMATIGILVFGTGLSLVLSFNSLTVGIIIAIVGILITLITFPICKILFLKLKKRYINEILILTEEILGEDSSKDINSSI